MAAIRCVRPENWPSDGTLDETIWSDPSEDNPNCDVYRRSKTLAERAAWDFQAALSEEDRFEIVVLNPALVIGPAF